jgi:hypothetical protein
MADLRIDIASEFVGAKAFKQAGSATTSLEKGVAKLGKTLLATFGATKVLQFAKSSAKAFLEDEAAATKLANSVKNLGLAYASDDIRKYIDSLTLATGVADNELRPALQSLLQVTGSVTKSQQMLGEAIDISRGSGVDLTTVANDLSQAYVGNLKGLRKYNLGLTKAELAASSFVDIQNRLNSLFGGSSTAFLNTYAGQMQILSNTASEAKEVIGKDLIGALILLSGEQGVDGLAKDMQEFAKFTGDAIYGIGVLAKKIDSIPILGDINFKAALQAVPLVGSYILMLAELGSAAKAAANNFNFASGGGAGAADTSRVAAAQAKKAEDAAKKRAKDLAALTAKQIKLLKEQTALQRAGGLFDLEQTQIIAALKGDISYDERKRLELQLALLTGNTAEASLLAGKLAYSQGLTKELVAFYKNLPDAKNPFAGWKAYLDAIEAQVLKIAKGGTGGGGGSGSSLITGGTMSNGSGTDFTELVPGLGAGSAFTTDPRLAQFNVSITLDGQELTNAVTKVQSNNSLSGKQIEINRRFGSFATP